jgi:hypothetical protein
VSLSECLIAEIRAEFPSFRLVPKHGDRLSRLIDVVLRVVTLGAQNAYLTHYHTVLGDTLYVPGSWDLASDLQRAVILRHERVHLRQRRRYGPALMTFLYLIPFFPLGLSYGRARLEWEAYSETLRATAEYRGIEAAEDPALRRQIVGRFCDGAYGWMWPFRSQVQKWFDRVLDEVRAEHDGSSSGSQQRSGSQGSSEKRGGTDG